jgi:hypothetical protein
MTQTAVRPELIKNFVSLESVDLIKTFIRLGLKLAQAFIRLNFIQAFIRLNFIQGYIKLYFAFTFT